MNLQHAMVERRIIRKMNYKIASQIDQNSKQVRLEEKHINVFQETCLTLEDLLQKLNRQVPIFVTVPKPTSSFDCGWLISASAFSKHITPLIL